MTAHAEHIPAALDPRVRCTACPRRVRPTTVDAEGRCLICHADAPVPSGSWTPGR